MSTRVDWTGYIEFDAWLRQLPHEIAIDGAQQMTAIEKDAAQDIVRGYPERSGELKRGVTVDPVQPSALLTATIRNTTFYSGWYESGIKSPRRTRRGWNRGVMPPAPVERQMMPKVARARQRMMARLIQLLRTLNFEVTTT